MSGCHMRERTMQLVQCTKASSTVITNAKSGTRPATAIRSRNQASRATIKACVIEVLLTVNTPTAASSGCEVIQFGNHADPVQFALANPGLAAGTDPAATSRHTWVATFAGRLDDPVLRAGSMRSSGQPPGSAIAARTMRANSGISRSRCRTNGSMIARKDGPRARRTPEIQTKVREVSAHAPHQKRSR